MKNILLLAFSILALNAAAQGYKLTFQPQQAAQEGVYFIGQHFRDQFIIMDSTHLKDGSITFVGKKKLTPGVYVLLNSDRKKMFDFMIDGSTKFTVSYDEKYTNSGMRVKGCEANTLMYEYMAKLDWARAKSKEIGKDK